MNDFISSLAPSDKARIDVIGRELAKFGLGIHLPHAHDRQGDIEPLAPGLVSYEQALQVQFVPSADVPEDALAVGWRWIDGKLEVCAGCCALP